MIQLGILTISAHTVSQISHYTHFIRRYNLENENKCTSVSTQCAVTKIQAEMIQFIKQLV